MICQICLRTDRKHHYLDQQLQALVTDLIDKFSTFSVTAATYCTECIHTLRKFYEFRKKCILANEILQNWTRVRRKYKKPLDTLYTLVPQTGLGYSKFENCKVYFHQEEESITAPPVNARPDYPHIVIDPSKLLSLGSTSHDDPDNIKNENTDKIDIKEEEIQDYTEKDEMNKYNAENPLKMELKTDIKREIIMDFEEGNTEIKGKRTSDDPADTETLTKRLCQPSVDINYAASIKTEENTEEFNVRSISNAAPDTYSSASDREQSSEPLYQPNRHVNDGQPEIKTENQVPEIDVNYILKEMGKTFAHQSSQVS